MGARLAVPVLAEPKKEDPQKCESSVAALAAAPEPTAVTETKPYEFEITIEKSFGQEKLSIDVKHCNGTLELLQIYEDGAIARVNDEKKSKGLEYLKSNDVIYKVNGISENTLQMSEEAKTKKVLVFSVRRQLVPY